MPTPTQSVVARGGSTVGDQLRDVVFENEMLKIEVDSLKSQLDGTGLKHLNALKEENNSLRRELDGVKVQLEEKTTQLDMLRNSDARFSTIGDSLQDLMKQLREQRERLEAMQNQANDKDMHIQRLEAQVEAQKENDAKAEAAHQSGADSAREAMIHELEKKEASWAAQVQDLKQTSQDLERALDEARSRCGTLESERDAARAEASRAVVAPAETVPCAQCAALRQECAQLKAQLAEKRVPAAAVFDPTSKEAKDFAEQRIQEAVQDRERRLRILIDQNASLLSRLSLAQEPQGAGAKPRPAVAQVQAPPPPAPAPAPRQASSTSPDDFKSRRKDARTAVERRFEEMLRNDVISKEDVQLLLQEVLDYQEKIDLDTQTQLYIKDIQMEDASQEMALRVERLENENATLTKTLQREAFHELQRGRRSSAAGPDPAATAAAAGTPTRAGTSGDRAGPLRASPSRGAYETALQLENPWGPARLAAQATGAAGTPSRHTDPSQAQGLADSPNYSLPQRAAHGVAPAQHGGSGGRGAANATQEFHVSCPACTFEQPYSNGKCQLCETSLPAPALRR